MIYRNGIDISLPECFRVESGKSSQTILQWPSKRSTITDVKVTEEPFATGNRRHSKICLNDWSPKLEYTPEEFQDIDTKCLVEDVSRKLQNHTVEFSRIRHLQLRQPLAWFPMLGSICESIGNELVEEDEESISFTEKVKSVPRLFDSSRHLSMRQPHAWFPMFECIPENMENELSERSTMTSCNFEGQDMHIDNLAERVVGHGESDVQMHDKSISLNTEFANKMQLAPSAFVDSRHTKVRKPLIGITVLESIGEKLEKYIESLESERPNCLIVNKKIVSPKLHKRLRKKNPKDSEKAAIPTDRQLVICETTKHAFGRLVKPTDKQDKQVLGSKNLERQASELKVQSSREKVSKSAQSKRSRTLENQTALNGIGKPASTTSVLSRHSNLRQPLAWFTKNRSIKQDMEYDETDGAPATLNCHSQSHKKEPTKLKEGHLQEQLSNSCLPENARSLDAKILNDTSDSACKASISSSETVTVSGADLDRNCAKGKIEPGSVMECSQQRSYSIPLLKTSAHEYPRHVALDGEATKPSAFIVNVESRKYEFLIERYAMMRQPLAWAPQLAIIMEEDEEDTIKLDQTWSETSRETGDTIEPQSYTEDKVDVNLSRTPEACSLAEILATFDPYSKKTSEFKVFSKEDALTSANYEETLLQTPPKFEAEDASEDPPAPRAEKSISRLRAALASSKRNTITFLRQSVYSFAHNPWRTL